MGIELTSCCKEHDAANCTFDPEDFDLENLKKYNSVGSKDNNNGKFARGSTARSLLSSQGDDFSP